MAGVGGQTSDQVADSLDLHERFVREWLLGQAAAGLIERHDDGTFELTDVQAAVLAGVMVFIWTRPEGGSVPAQSDLSR